MNRSSTEHSLICVLSASDKSDIDICKICVHIWQQVRILLWVVIVTGHVGLLNDYSNSFLALIL